MNFKQLRAFKEVMHTGSVSEAARRLFRSQPAISALIASLEDEIGFKLFIRKDMRLQPVPEAYYLLKEATEILEHLEKANHAMQSIRRLEKGTLKIVSMPGPAVYLLPCFIEQFLNGRNTIKVSLISKTSPQVELLMSAQQYDIGFADYNTLPQQQQNESLLAHELFDFECLCAMRHDDPLSEKDLITPEDLDDRPMATLWPEHSVTRATRTSFEQHNARYNNMFEAQHFIQLFRFIEQGMAYSVLDRLSAESYQRQHRYHNIVFRPYAYPIKLTTSLITPVHSPLSSLAQQFLVVFREQLKQIQQRPSA